MTMEMKKIADNPELIEEAAGWFHTKWNVPTEAYLESMEECLQGNSAVPQWDIVMDGGRVIA